MPLLPKYVEPEPEPEETHRRTLFGRKSGTSSKLSSSKKEDVMESRSDNQLTSRPSGLGLGARSLSKDGSTVVTHTTRNTYGTSVFQDRRQMKVVFRQFGDEPKEIMAVEQDDVPEPHSPDHVIIKVQAATVTIRDCFLRLGHCFDVVNPTSLPMTPGHDVVGKIVSLGDKVKAEGHFKEGDRVAALVRTGGNARYASVPVKNLVRVPHTVDAAEAACMVSVYTAAYQSMKMVTSKGPMFSLKGKKVLIIGGMDSVGQALVQMCNKARAEIYATCPPKRHAYMRNVLGATPLPEDAKEWLREIEGEMDVVFDGRCEDGLDAACKALGPDGELVCFGYGAMIKQPMGVFGAPMVAYVNRWRSRFTRAKTVDIWESFNRDPEQYKKHLASLFQLLKWNKLRPHIAKRVALSEVPFAHGKLETGEVRGNVVCLPWKRVGSRHIVTSEEERE